MNAIYLFQMFILFIFLGLVLAQPIIQITGSATGSDGLNCDNAEGYQDKANCSSTDSLAYFFIVTVFGLAGLIVGGIGK